MLLLLGLLFVFRSVLSGHDRLRSSVRAAPEQGSLSPGSLSRPAALGAGPADRADLHTGDGGSTHLSGVISGRAKQKPRSAQESVRNRQANPVHAG